MSIETYQEIQNAFHSRMEYLFHWWLVAYAESCSKGCPDEQMVYWANKMQACTDARIELLKASYKLVDAA